jgi:putative colanic acid biosynthesis glycosyltransferase WcaI
MRILAVNQFYAPDESATSQLLTELCEDLAAVGHRVTVIASRGTYLGGSRLVPRETRDGVRIVRPWATSLGKANIPRRLGDYVTFWAGALAAALHQDDVDVILALTTPPIIAAGAALAAARRGVPLVTWVQDVYPEVAAEFGVLSARGVPYRTLELLVRATHSATASIVALSQGMQRRLERQGAPTERVRVIPNWADGSVLKSIPHDANPFRNEQALNGKFVAMYSGNLGVGHDIGTFVDAARLLRKRLPHLVCCFVGDGARRQEAEKRAAGLDNVRFLPYQPKRRIAESLSAADVHLVSLREGLDGLLVPSKFYGALATGRPVCYVGPDQCEVAEVTRRHELGWAGRPGEAGRLAAALEALALDTARVREVGKRARQVFERFYDRPVAVRAWREVLEGARRAGDDFSQTSRPNVWGSAHNESI